MTAQSDNNTGNDISEKQQSLSRFDRRTKAAADALRTILRDFCLERLGQEPETARQQSLRLNLDFTIGSDWKLDFQPALYEQLNEQFDDLGARTNVYAAGSVYNYFAESSTDNHCRPPSSLSVFDEFDSKGIPCWCDLSQALLKNGDNRTAQLYDRPPPILAKMVYGRELNKKQLHTYGRASKTYTILGQVIAGYFQLPKDKSIQGDQRLAITFQLVETRESNRQFALKLNMLSFLEPHELLELLTLKRYSGLQRAYNLAVRDVEKLESQVRAARRSGNLTKANELLRHVPAILKRLTASIERNDRQNGRRTTHAQQRREHQRPIHKALDDAASVKSDRFFYDIKHESWITVNSSGRTHAFNPEGRHITSFTMKPDAVEHRIRTQRWRTTTQEELEAFKQSLSTPVQNDL